MAEVNLNKEIFTTFEVAKICSANITSIKNWIEKGKLRAFRTPGGHYRVERAVMEDFLNRYAMPNPFADRDRKNLVVAYKDPAMVENIRRGLGRNVEVVGTDQALETTLLVGDRRPDVLVMDFTIANFDGAEIARVIRLNDSYKRMQIIAYIDALTTEQESDLRGKGVNYFVIHNTDMGNLHAVIKEALV
jgi:excisionase family DNA binding protein